MEAKFYGTWWVKFLETVVLRWISNSLYIVKDLKILLSYGRRTLIIKTDSQNSVKSEISRFPKLEVFPCTSVIGDHMIYEVP